MPIDAVLIGAGGFGREVLDVVEAHNLAVGADSTRGVRIIGVVDDNPSDLNIERLDARGYSHLGSLAEILQKDQIDSYLLGVGSPSIRRAIADKLDEHGWTPLTLVHPNAVVGTVKRIGAGTIICGGVQLSTNTILGRHVHLNPNATIGHDSVLDDFVSVNPGAIVSGDVTVGAESLVGAGATILQGLEIGSRALVGACACVTKNVTDDVVVVGVPAHIQEEVSSS